MHVNIIIVKGYISGDPMSTYLILLEEYHITHSFNQTFEIFIPAAGVLQHKFIDLLTSTLSLPYHCWY